MLFTRMIGDAKVSNIIEYTGPTHDPAFVFPDLPEGSIEKFGARMTPDHYVPAMNRFVISMQIWVMELGDKVVVIDTGVGNAKERPAARTKRLNTLTKLWLEAAGASADRVTHVINTHLHSDHVGWNTELVDGKWVPTFPNARYLLPRADFDFLKKDYDSGKTDVMAGSFADSVIPVLEAGLIDIYDNDTPPLAGCLGVEAANGHTPGMVTLRLSSKGEEGIFSADIFHSPMQIYVPTQNTTFCMIPDKARASRAAFLQRAAERGSLVMPCHFGAPYCGYIRGNAQDGYSLEPEKRVLGSSKLG